MNCKLVVVVTILHVADRKSRARFALDVHTIASPLVGQVAVTCGTDKEGCIPAHGDRDIAGLAGDKYLLLLTNERDLPNSAGREGLITAECLVDVEQFASRRADRHVDEPKPGRLCEDLGCAGIGIDHVDISRAKVASEVLVVEPRWERWVRRLVKRTTNDRTTGERVVREVVDVAVRPQRIDEISVRRIVRISRTLSKSPAVVGASLENVQFFEEIAAYVANKDLAVARPERGLEWIAQAIGVDGPVWPFKLVVEGIVGWDRAILIQPEHSSLNVV